MNTRAKKNSFQMASTLRSAMLATAGATWGRTIEKKVRLGDAPSM